MTAHQILERHIANVAKPRGLQDLTVYSPEIVCEFPYAPEGHTQFFTGREKLSAFLAAIHDFSENHYFDQLESFPTESGIVAAFRSNFTVKETGRQFSEPMIYIFAIENAQITRYREYYNPQKVLWAFGESD